MENKKGIAVVGTVLVDKIYGISAYPDAGELTHIRSIDRSVGGLVPNDGIDLKRLAPELDVVAVCKVGDDGDGQFVIDTLKNNGIDVSGVKVAEGETTSFTDVMSIIGGQRTFFTYPGACASFGCDDIQWDELDVKMLHLGYFLLLDKVDNGDGMKILKKASELDIKTSIDLVSENSDRYSLVIPCLPYVDNLIINETEAGNMTGIEPTEENLEAIADKLLEMGVRERVIIHMPMLGICKSKDGKYSTMPSVDVPRDFIKGKTGAGDAFCSGALLGIHNGVSDEEILEYAQVAAMASLRTADASSGIEELSKLREMAKQFM